MFSQGAEVIYLQRGGDGGYVLRRGLVVAVFEDRCIPAVPPNAAATEGQISSVKSVDEGSQVAVVSRH